MNWNEVLFLLLKYGARQKSSWINLQKLSAFDFISNQWCTQFCRCDVATFHLCKIACVTGLKWNQTRSIFEDYFRIFFFGRAPYFKKQNFISWSVSSIKKNKIIKCFFHFITDCIILGDSEFFIFFWWWWLMIFFERRRWGQSQRTPEHLQISLQHIQLPKWKVIFSLHQKC